MSNANAQQPAAGEQPGPTDVTLDEVLAATSQQLSLATEQLIIARLKIRKQEELITSLQAELVAKSQG